MFVCSSVAEVTLVNKLPSQHAEEGGPGDGARRLSAVLPEGSKSILILRVGLLDATSNAAVLPDYCDEACVTVRVVSFSASASGV